MSAANEMSKQCDVVLYDGDNCPRLLADESHSLFPIESVYATIEVKSTLDAKELADAAEKIASVKKLASHRHFNYGKAGLMTTLPAPIPFGAIFAFTANRSIEAIADQAREIFEGSGNPHLDPELIVVLDAGIVGPKRAVRNYLNQFEPIPVSERTKFKRLSKHALLGFYLHLMREIGLMTLEPLELSRYLKMPEKVGGHTVVGHDRFRIGPPNTRPSGPVRKISNAGINKILEHCASHPPVTRRQHLLNSLSVMPVGMNEEYLEGNRSPHGLG
jgi:hypothetical protein